MYLYLVATVSVFMLSLGVASAYNAVSQTLLVPYEILPVNIEVAGQQYFLGELDGFPEMYEIVFEATTTLSLAIRAVDDSGSDSLKLSGLIIRDKTVRGVEEIARLRADDALWEEARDPVSALTYFAGSDFLEEVPPGTYRIEVSTPNNTGKYILVFGDSAISTPYGTTLGSVAATYDFYGVSKLGMIRSPLIFYPLGIIVLIGLIVGTWHLQRKRKNTNA